MATIQANTIVTRLETQYILWPWAQHSHVIYGNLTIFIPSRVQMYYQLSEETICLWENFRCIQQKYTVSIGNAPVTCKYHHMTVLSP